MKEVRVRFIESDVERVFYERPADPKAPPKVEIVTAGLHSLVYVNGQRINGVMEIDLPVSTSHAGPQIGLRFMAFEIVQRSVTREEFNRLADA